MVSLAWVREPDPASWLEGNSPSKKPTFGPKLRGFEPVYPWDRPRPIPSETMMSINDVALDRAGILVFRDAASLQPARQVNAVVQRLRKFVGWAPKARGRLRASVACNSDRLVAAG